MEQTLENKNKAIVLEVFDTLFNSHPRSGFVAGSFGILIKCEPITARGSSIVKND